MDYKKIGLFILAERKAKNLTQEQLSEKLCVSPKTVSKWENGNGLPDTELLLPICDIFGITLNELLSGERLREETSKEQADNNLISVLRENEMKIKKYSKIMNWVIAITVALLYVTIGLITQKWQYTWLIWIIYCVYRCVTEFVYQYIRKKAL